MSGYRQKWEALPAAEKIRLRELQRARLESPEFKAAQAAICAELRRRKKLGEVRARFHAYRARKAAA